MADQTPDTEAKQVKSQESDQALAESKQADTAATTSTSTDPQASQASPSSEASTGEVDVAGAAGADAEVVSPDEYAASGVNSNVPMVKLEDELKQSFIDYAMSVIVDRALPDVRDGLKPVHRRVLYDMYDLKIWHNGPTKKSARVVGDVIGRFHPHGDAAVYDTIVRMAQWFSMRAPLIYGQGNFGNLDGDGAAAMRYTEVRMTKIAEMMLQDIDKETVNTYPNYDGNEQIPEVLPTRYPNLLVNGSAGIAVGLATNIPPHNLGEVIDGTLALLENPNLTLDELMEYIPGPDFPTGGLIIQSPEIKKAYATGRGRCLIRARTHSETDKQGRTTIYVDEIPYMVNKSVIVKEIAELVREKKIEGIAEVNDLSDKDNQVRIAIDLKRDAYEEAVLNNLYQHTSMQSSFSFNVIALVNNRPRQLSLIEILQEFLKFRREVVTRRTVYLLRQDRRKAFYNEGLIVAKNNIDEVVHIIRDSANAEEAKQRLMAKEWDGSLLGSLIEYDANGDNICLPVGADPLLGLHNGKYTLSEDQAKGILQLQLQRLTHLATDELLADYNNLKLNIHGYLEILNSTERMNEVIREELLEAKDTFKDKRRSNFIYVDGFLSKADLVSKQAVLITLSQQGYIKYQDLSLYEASSRGTKGNAAAKLKDEDYIVTSTVCNSHDSVMCFTTKGRVFVTKVYDLPTSNNKTWRGRPIQNLFDLEEGEAVRRILPISSEVDINKTFVVIATAKGGIKRVDLKAFKGALDRANSKGIKAISLEDDDEVVAVELTSGEDDIVLFSSNGRALRFCEYVKPGKGELAKVAAAGDDKAETESEAETSEVSELKLDSVDDDLDADTDTDTDGDGDGDGDGDSDELTEDERIARELKALQRYLAARKSGGGVRSRGRTAGTNKGLTLVGDDTRLAGMLIVPADELTNPQLNYIMITEDGMGKRGRLIGLTGKLRRGSRGIKVCSRAASTERVVDVLRVDTNSDYLVFSNTGNVLRSHVNAITCRSRTAGFVRLKRMGEDELVIGLQEIPPEVVAAIDESAEARAEEKRQAEAAAEVMSATDVAADEAERAAERASAAADLDFDDQSETKDTADASDNDDI